MLVEDGVGLEVGEKVGVDVHCTVLAVIVSNDVIMIFLRGITQAMNCQNRKKLSEKMAILTNLINHI